MYVLESAYSYIVVFKCLLYIHAKCGFIVLISCAHITVNINSALFCVKVKLGYYYKVMQYSNLESICTSAA